MKRQIMTAEIKRNADRAVGKLLRRIDRRIRPYHDRGIGENGAPSELTAARSGVGDTTVIAPLAGVVHVGLALLEKLAVAGERGDALRRRHTGLDPLVDAGLTVGPFDTESFL